MKGWERCDRLLEKRQLVPGGRGREWGAMQNRGPMSNVDQFSSCKINTMSISWNMKMNQTCGIHSFEKPMRFCVMRCHLCDALQNRDYSWFGGTCSDYHPCHLRLILDAGQRSGGISHISPSLKCRRKIPKKDFSSQRDFFGFQGTMSYLLMKVWQHIGQEGK